MIALDTHVLVWWMNGDPALSKVAKAAIEKEQVRSDIIVSSISAWEIAMLIERGRLHRDSWLSAIAQIDAVRFLPLKVEIATKSVVLPDSFHPDPADRMIVATACKLAAPLMTRDEKIHAYPRVKVMW